MLRTTLVALGVSLMALAARADDPAQTSLLENVRIPANTGFVTSVSPDKQVMTIIFDNVVQEVERTRKGGGGTLGQTASASKTVTLNVPYSTDQKSVKMAMDVRGFASTDPDATVKLIVHAGDVTQVIRVSGKADGKDDKKGKRDKGDKSVKLKGQTKASVLEGRDLGREQSGDFLQRVEFTVQPHAARPVCPITLILLAEHDTDTADSGGALLIVDSLDLSFVTGGKDRSQYGR